MGARNDDDDDEPVALFLSGWSDGPLPQLERVLRRRGLRCVYVSLPMPPCGVTWCANPFVLLLAVVLWLTIVAAERLAATHPALIVVAVAVGSLLARLCVAGVVRFSVHHGAANARRLLRRHRVAMLVGFSWGGGVALDLLGAWRGPTLLLAPAAVVMGKIGLANPRRKVVDDPTRVRVVLARFDDFCPQPASGELFDHLSMDVVEVADNHALCGRGASEAIVAAVAALLPNTAPGAGGALLS